MMLSDGATVPEMGPAKESAQTNKASQLGPVCTGAFTTNYFSNGLEQSGKASSQTIHTPTVGDLLLVLCADFHMHWG